MTFGVVGFDGWCFVCFEFAEVKILDEIGCESVSCALPKLPLELSAITSRASEDCPRIVEVRLRWMRVPCRTAVGVMKVFLVTVLLATRASGERCNHQ